MRQTVDSVLEAHLPRDFRLWNAALFGICGLPSAHGHESSQFLTKSERRIAMEQGVSASQPARYSVFYKIWPMLDDSNLSNHRRTYLAWFREGLNRRICLEIRRQKPRELGKVLCFRALTKLFIISNVCSGYMIALHVLHNVCALSNASSCSSNAFTYSKKATQNTLDNNNNGLDR
jgi:hypothetical protein